MQGFTDAIFALEPAALTEKTQKWAIAVLGVCQG
jgi:hypothetical protein